MNEIGYVIEFKTVNKKKKETVKSALAAALTQIKEKQYATELQERALPASRRWSSPFLEKKSM